jgi:hypothetical protein
MPADSPKNQHVFPRGRVVEVIEHAAEDAMRQLRHAGIPETQALLVMQRIHTFCLQSLRELDQVYREFEELVAQDPNRSEAHQAWFADRTTTMLMHVEVAIASLVTQAIDKLKDEYKRESLPQRDVITTVPIKPPPSAWQQALNDLRRINPWILLFLGLSLWFFLGLVSSHLCGQ